jgi:stage II sporulation protein M
MGDLKKFFVRNYKKVWKFGVESRWFFVFVTGLFAFAFLVGFAYPVFFREGIFKMLGELRLEIIGKSAFELVGFIFLNNLKVSFFAMILGIGFGIFPVVTTIINGYLVGFVAREAVIIGGIFELWRLLPHGVFELPAVIFSVGIGVKIGMSIFQDKFRYNFREGLRFFVFVVLPLLVVAGIIEGVLIGLVN